MLRRPTFYAIVALLFVMLGLTAYLLTKLDSPAIQEAARKAHDSKTPATVTTGTISANAPAPSGASANPIKIDPELQRLADELNSPSSSPERDLEIVREFLNLYSKAFRNGYPVGLNEDITAALTGTANPDQKACLFPPNSPAIRNGALVDRWGSPLWFHPESGTKMEIRSAGPDKQLFTNDDVILTH